MGIAASSGIAIGPALKLPKFDLSFENQTIDDVGAEIRRLQTAVMASKNELIKIQHITQKDLGSHEAGVFQFLVSILSNQMLIDQMTTLITNQKVTAEMAVTTVLRAYHERQKQAAVKPVSDQQIHEVMQRVLSHLLGAKPIEATALNQRAIVVAHELSPIQTAQLLPTMVQAIVTDVGGTTSHSVIMSRNFEIPIVVGLQNAETAINNGDMMIVNGSTGEVIVKPTSAQLEENIHRQREYEQQLHRRIRPVGQTKVTADRDRSLLAANINDPADVTKALANGARAIGLFRTEFLYLKTHQLPTEAEQFKAYKAVLTQMGEKPVIIRTADIGGDKQETTGAFDDQMNPYLGLRGLRLSLTHQSIFRTQLRALLRASAYGKLSIMFPMVTTLHELRVAKALLDQERIKLLSEGVAIGRLKVGMMVEVPAVAIMADQFVNDVDFMSLGTNDLTQYLLAADRGNEQVADLYQPEDPAIFRLVKSVIDACHDHQIPAFMCGELAADPLAIPILKGMGLDGFSMNPAAISYAKQLIDRLNTRRMVTLANEVVTMAADQKQVIDFVHQATANGHATYK